MTDKHLDNAEFFKRLAELCESTHQQDGSSIFLTQKRLSHGQDVQAQSKEGSEHVSFPDVSVVKPLPVLMRATNGMPADKRADKIKISTVIQPDDLGTFFVRYQEICKNGLQGLKKRDRSAKKKAAKAKKKKDVDGTKAA